MKSPFFLVLKEKSHYRINPSDLYCNGFLLLCDVLLYSFFYISLIFYVFPILQQFHKLLLSVCNLYQSVILTVSITGCSSAGMVPLLSVGLESLQI